MSLIACQGCERKMLDAIMQDGLCPICVKKDPQDRKKVELAVNPDPQPASSDSEKVKIATPINERVKKINESQKKGREVLANPEVTEQKETLIREHKEKRRQLTQTVAEKVENTEKMKQQRAIDVEYARRVLAKKHLLPFIMRFNDAYQAGWVHKDICRRLEQFSEDVANKKSPRLMLFMPPRSGKSEIVSRNFPAWHLARHPNHEFISTSYSGSLAMGFSRKVRELMRDPAYQVLTQTRLKEDSQSVEHWETTDGGGYAAAGVGGPITGKGAHCLIIDDPIKNAEDADSENNRQIQKDWYSSTAYTRLAPGGGVLIIMTRWHDDDLSGWLEREMRKGGDQWEVIRYPAIAEQDEKYRKKGEALHPERYDVAAFERIRRAVGPRVWQALYQQNPVPDEGSFFKKEMVRHFDRLPPHGDLLYYCMWDLAIGQKETNDWTVGLVAAVDRAENIYIVDIIRDRMGSMELVDKIIDVYERYNPELVGIEKGHLEMAIGPFLRKRIAERNAYGMRLHELKPGRRDKQSRARAIQGRMEQGRVLLPQHAPWLSAFISELLQFPNGKHDDQVDVLAYLGLTLGEMYVAAEPRVEHKKSWRDNLHKFSKSHSRKSAMGA